MSNTVTWRGHAFTVYSQGGNWNAVPGVYLFCGLSPQNLWIPIYVGQTDSFRTRIPLHERWNEARNLGATHVLALVVQAVANRDAIEQALVREFQPTLNTHYRQSSVS